MATFSIIIPVYRGEETVRRCVESILQTECEDIEIILVEDCSPDNSWLECQRLSAEYSNVVCLRNETNRGVSYTRNRGLDAASGDYLLFADCDDWTDPGFVPAFQQAATSGIKFAICGYINHDEKNSGCTLVYDWKDQDDFVVKDLSGCLLDLYNDILIHQVWNKLFRKDLVRKYGIRFDEKISIGEDTRFVLEYLKKTGIQQVMLVNRPLYHYMRDQEGSLMFRVGYESVDEPLKNLRMIYELSGMPETEIQKNLVSDRQKQIEVYAYLIMHNTGMPLIEKRRLTLALDPQNGKKLFQHNFFLYVKECIVKWSSASKAK